MSPRPDTLPVDDPPELPGPDAALDGLRHALDLAAAVVPAATLLQALAEVQAHVAGRLSAEQARYITREEAAELARVPVRRVKAWSRLRSCTWNVRAGQRTALVNEANFRVWIARNVRMSTYGAGYVPRKPGAR